MKLYLIRHGETVDNVAGLYAGVRDSALTNHGVEQARSLGGYFAKHGIKFTHLYSSPLTRAQKTAEAIRIAQSALAKGDDGHDFRLGSLLEVEQVLDLVEQDFGYYEGKPFYARSESSKTGREAHYERHQHEPGFVDVESKESMGKRADAFLKGHLLPVLERQNEGEEQVVAVVSHGILLSHLWRRLLLRLPRRSLSIVPEIVASKRNIVLEHLGGWSNTGYLELELRKDTSSAPRCSDSTTGNSKGEAEVAKVPTPVPPATKPESAAVTTEVSVPESESSASKGMSPPQTLQGWSTTIVAVDSTAHLVDVKRQRGGIGRLAHDEGQKKLDGFFKRQKLS